MGVVLVGVAVFVASMVATYFMYSKKMPESSFKPSTMEDFNITRASEGSPFPIVFGKVKITGNILHYGNLKTVKQKSDGGGKGGGGSQTIGYHYYLDVWQSICIGPAKILGTYKDNKKWITTEINPQWSGIMADDGDGKLPTVLTTNRGDGVSNFSVPVEYFAPLARVCTVWMQSVWCGSGTSLPNIHFIVQSQHITPYADLPNGMNPASVIWAILVGAGAEGSSIDTTSFTDSANYWMTRGYGINLTLGTQGKVRDQIREVLTPIGGFYFENGGRHFITTNNPYAASVDTITDDFVKFTIARRSWEDTINDLKATFTDASQDYTVRTAVVQNSASYNLLKGKIYTKTINLECFNSLETTQKRIAEVIKSESYPYAEIEFVTGLKYAWIPEGSIITINSTKYGIQNGSYRITMKDLEGLETNEVGFQAVQVVETLFDENYTPIGTGVNTWTRQLVAPVPLTKTRIIESPRNAITDSPGIIVLAAQESGFEVEFFLYHSTDNANYSMAKRMNAFNLYGTLKIPYPSTTYDIDDEVGVVVSLFKPEYVINSLTRSGLFSTERFLIIDNEIMKFQGVTVNVDGSVTLTGVIRGTMFTSKAYHNTNAGVWIVDDPTCYFYPNNELIGGYYKIVPRNIIGTVPLSSVSAISVAESALSRTPLGISRVFAARVGSSISFIVSVKDTSNLGAGISGSNVFSVNSDSDAMIEYKLSADSTWTRLNPGIGSFIIVNAAAITVNVRYIEFGKYSSTVNLTVGATDGNYTV